MAIYVVVEPPRKSGRDAPDAIFVRDGFSVLAFLIPPLWLLWHRLWIEAALALAVAMTLAAIGEMAGLGLTGSLLSLLVSIYVGLEGAALRLAALRRRGWYEWGAVEADSFDDAETRHLVDAAPAEADDIYRPAQPGSNQPAAPARRSGMALGLLTYPGKP
ncbi:MAG: DUF2628 domain-containing protein [Pseudaminobacter sp.]|nr:DUF2628 domain-containing protein [Pseudaminobacter sp.]